jgi:hypothetical protein
LTYELLERLREKAEMRPALKEAIRMLDRADEELRKAAGVLRDAEAAHREAVHQYEKYAAALTISWANVAAELAREMP